MQKVTKPSFFYSQTLFDIIIEVFYCKNTSSMIFIEIYWIAFLGNF